MFNFGSDFILQRYLSEVKVTHLTVDKRDPEFGFYDQTKGIMTAYSVKPAVFDLFLTATITAYLTAVYFGVQVSYIFIKNILHFNFSFTIIRHFKCFIPDIQLAVCFCGRQPTAKE